MHGQFAFCCDCQPSYRTNFVLMLVVIIFWLFKACYSVQKYTCVNKHMIFDNGTKAIDQNASFMIIESVNYKIMSPTTPCFFSVQESQCCV